MVTPGSTVDLGDMNQQVPEHYHTLSERVSRVLDVLGYSKEDRDRKVRCATTWEVFRNISKLFKPDIFSNKYIFGSRGEGSTGPGLQSDRDTLHEDDRLNIVTDLSDCQPYKWNLLMVYDDNTHPGYVKLQKVDMLPGNIHCLVYQPQNQSDRVDLYGRITIPSEFLHHLRSAPAISGPSIHNGHTVKELSSDNVITIRCTRLPNEVNEWLQRRRPHGWPKPLFIQNARKDGCFASAVGHPHSLEKDLEWRLSFSFTERELIRSFEDTAMKVYILLKMIKKTYIEPVLGDAFSSYQCKVCILWVREKTPTELWRTENLLYCLTLCIKQLYEWAGMGYCPDYFIITNNIYDRKIFGETQLILTKKLGDLVSEDCRILFGIQCCNMGQLLLNDCSSLDIIRNSIITSTYSNKEALLDYRLFIEGTFYYRVNMLNDIPQEYNILISWIRRMIHALQHAPDTLQIYPRHILMTLLSRLGFYVVSVCKENAHSLSQEEVDYLMALASRCLSLGINSDATSVRIKLCGLGTMLGNYDLTEICLQHISDHKMRYMFSSKLYTSYTLKCNWNLYLDKFLTERYSTEELLKNQTSFSVVYLMSEISIIPMALRMEMFGSIGVPSAIGDKKVHFWHDWAVVDSLMCLYFFQYLNYSRQGKARHQLVALENMIHVIRTEPHITHRETELNLVGYCLMRESQFRHAYIYFYTSLKLCPHHNAAKFYLGILFRKAHIASRRRERN